MRFIRAGRRRGLVNYEDGKLYWMKPRHAAYPWWEPVDNVDLPIVKPATKEESVYEPRDIDMESQATISDSGVKFTPSGDLIGSLRSAREVEAEELKSPKQALREEALGFPVSELPSQEWTRAQLFAYIAYRDAEDRLPSGYKSRAVLLGIASSLA